MTLKKIAAVASSFAVGAMLFIARAEDEGHGHGHHGGGKPIDESKLPPAATTAGLTFAKDIQPILQNYSCTDCHDADKAKAKLRLDTLAYVMKGGEDGKIVMPGQSAKSKIVIAMSRLDPESAMPPNRRPGKDVGPDGKKLPPVKHVTADEIGIVRAWIDQGAH